MFGFRTKTAWNARVACETTLAITEDPSKLNIDSIHMKRLERWTVIVLWLVKQGRLCSQMASSLWTPYITA